MTTEYVCGFLFSPIYDRVVLIRKNRPEWQSGKLNGVGGHKESWETPDEAMAREFEEEAGLVINSWNHFATLSVASEPGTDNIAAIVYFFETSSEIYEQVESCTDEEVTICKYPLKNNDRGNMISNVETLLRLAMDNWSFVRPIELRDIPAFDEERD